MNPHSWVVVLCVLCLGIVFRFAVWAPPFLSSTTNMRSNDWPFVVPVAGIGVLRNIQDPEALTDIQNGY